MARNLDKGAAHLADMAARGQQERERERSEFGSPEQVDKARKYARVKLRPVLEQLDAERPFPSTQDILLRLRDAVEASPAQQRRRLDDALFLLALSGQWDEFVRDHNERIRRKLTRQVIRGATGDG